ncbi:hypothetical protein [Nocardia sp. NPDC049707]|uniref:hypothetical protein n=1 Tax=Nocardia sp. NPDC049707 TaxID=3154735 RepID=UPI003413C77E
MPRVVTALSTGLLVGAFSIVVPVAIWPGEAKLTAPLFCSSPATEPMVVSDTFHDSEGTSTNYTLYCVGDHGILTNEGFALPLLVMLTAHIVIVTTPDTARHIVQNQGRACARSACSRSPSIRTESAHQY